jgi:hypothetical protein
MTVWLFVTILATAGPQGIPATSPALADTLGILGPPASAAPGGKDLFSGFS